MIADALQTLVEAAILAPSGDNTQPWRFEIDETQRSITVRLDPTRDPSPMNAGQCMARVAIGCAVENMRQTAERNHWPCQIAYLDDAAQVTVDQEAQTAGTISDAIRNRVSNRRVYSGEPIAVETLANLTAACQTDGPTGVHWITESSQRRTLCELIGRADGILLSAEGPRKAFLEKVRFDQQPTAVVDEGLSLGSLELSAPQQMAMRMMPRVPNWLLQAAGGKSLFRAAALKLAKSASGFCLVTTSATGNRSDYEVGRVWERAWLALADQSLASQPTMSLLVLQNIRDNGSDEQKAMLDQAATAAVLADFADFVATFSDATPRALLRFGIAGSPTARVGRRQVDDVVESIQPA